MPQQNFDLAEAHLIECQRVRLCKYCIFRQYQFSFIVVKAALHYLITEKRKIVHKTRWAA